MRTGRRALEYPERYLDAIIAAFDGRRLTPYEPVREALSTCDVVLTVETPYDFRLLEDLRAAGTRTVVVGNLELLAWLREPELPRPDLFVAPSEWHSERWPDNTVFLPHPVDRERLPFSARARAQTFLHVGGYPAMRDRAGTLLVLEAAQHVQRDLSILVRSQVSVPLPRPRSPRIRVRVSDAANYWDVYRTGDVLIAPRRYGGQSLPLLEALSLGIPVIALDREPERSLLPPTTLVQAHRTGEVGMKGGSFGVWDADPAALASKIDELASQPQLVAELSHDADRRAGTRSWGVLGPTWQRTLEDLAA